MLNHQLISQLQEHDPNAEVFIGNQHEGSTRVEAANSAEVVQEGFVLPSEAGNYSTVISEDGGIDLWGIAEPVIILR